jgi:hypothetical protein
VALIFGLVASNRWETILRFMNSVSFGVKDPLFNLDVSFYVVTLPLVNFIQVWLLGAVITILVAVLLMYLVNFSLRGVSFTFNPRMLVHLALLGAFLMLVLAFNHFLDIYELLLSPRGAAYGAGYTDIHARLPALRFLTAVSLVASLLFVASIFTGGVRLMVGAFGLWVVATIVVGAIFPAAFQRFLVNPNELSREETYIQRNIQFTRYAYGLERVQEQSFSFQPQLTREAVANNPQTIRNIRLWDYRPIRDTYNQIQFLRLYYSFVDIDVDRYWINGEYRQVMLSARELFPENLPPDAQRWVNQRLQYTHGYGVAMSPVTDFTPEGRPLFFLKDIPPAGVLEVNRPEIYYGENTRSYVIVNSRMPEFDYPTKEDTPVYTHYQGRGGVRLGSFLRRLAYAWQFADINILISGQITPESRIQYRRQIQERVAQVAPFLRLDRDPYLVVADGKLWWIQDAYTVTDRYPYSTPYRGDFNYIRNSVKVVIDAYDGSVRFFVADPEDPLLQIYRRIFPDLFEPLERMPDPLRAHLRYPVDLFNVQTQMYLKYHMRDPRVFYNQEDQWSIPMEVFFGKPQPVEPYYIIMRLPGEEKEEFVLILPFTPANKPNLVAWLAARSDPPHYGNLVVFFFPRDRQVDGPSQVEARIDNDPYISQQFTLWGQVGSKVIRGNLLVIPLGETVIYVEPVYLQSEALAFPELKRVIVASSEKVAMTAGLEEGLFALLEEAPPLVTPPTPQPGTSIPLERVEEQVKRIGVAIESLKKAIRGLEEALGNLEELLGGERR